MKRFVCTLLGVGSFLFLPMMVWGQTNSPLQERADRFLDLANAGYQALYRVQNIALWNAATDVTPAHDAASDTAGEAMAAFTGNPALINEAKALLEHRSELKPLTVLQLDRVILNAAEGPMTNPKLVAERVAAETKQASTLNSFVFHRDGKVITANEIDDCLATNRDLARRRAVWEASKMSGPALKPGLVNLQKLRNGVAQELNYPDYFALQVASYGMTTEEMIAMQDNFMRELRPLYLQLHTWVSANMDDRFKGRTSEWIVKTAEQFYTGLGFAKLPDSFWQLSDLYPVKPGDPRKKNTHASCWHIDLDKDIRSLQSVEPNAEWFYTAHHELGHAYYFMSYTRPEVPPLLRIGANPAFHEGIGELIALASCQVPYLKSVGVLPENFQANPTDFLLDDALSRAVPFIFWSSGTMTHWEADVYAGKLDPGQWNARWWQYVRNLQGIEPPSPRGEEFCDAATKTHINDTPFYYYSYAIATVLKFQLHDYIARRILHQPPQACNYANNKEVGDFLRGILVKGGTEDWRKVLRDATGEDLSTRAMVEYFKPLMAWLREQNKGRPIGWE